MVQLHRKILNWVSIYTPVFLLGALALASYLLARYTPPPEPMPMTIVARHEPDYFMRNFAVRSFDTNGNLKSEVFGTELRHFPDSDTSEIDAPRIRKVNYLGRVTVGTADRAIANGDGSEVQLIGNAVVIRDRGELKTRDSLSVVEVDDRFEFRGDFIQANTHLDILKSNRPAILTRGLDRFSADSFSYDHIQGVIQLNGRVSGQLTPRENR